MRVIVMKVSLKADWAHSLKEKRMVVKSIIAKLQNKFNISVGEIENQDIHNLITIGIAGIDVYKRQGGMYSNPFSK